MASIAPDDSTGPEGAGFSRPDRLTKLVQITLAIYLTPVIALVCAIGGISILVNQAARVANSSAAKTSRTIAPNHLPTVRVRRAGMKLSIPTDRQHVRV